MSFQLVDRIQKYRVGESAQGTFQPHLDGEPFPLGLMVESIGQLAAWTVMPKLDFEQRPVAASAGRIDVIQIPEHDAPVDLEVTITAIRPHAISYHGQATRGGKPCIQMQRAIGPLLPMAEFDDKENVKSVFEQLRSEGLSARRTVQRSDYQPVSTIGPVAPGEGFLGSMELPRNSPVYAEHFPKQPVYPATLLLQSQFDEARRAYANGEGELPAIRRVSGVKVRAFSGPGESLTFRGVEQPDAGDQRFLRIESWRGDTRVSAAGLYLDK